MLPSAAHFSISSREFCCRTRYVPSLAYEIEFSDAGVERPLLDELDSVVLDAQLAGVRVHGAPLQDADLALLH